MKSSIVRTRMKFLLTSVVLAVLASCGDGSANIADAPVGGTADAHAIDAAAAKIDGSVAHVDARGIDAHVSGDDAAVTPDAARADATTLDAARADAARADAARSDDARTDDARADAARTDDARADAAPPDATPPDAAPAPLLSFSSSNTQFTVGSSAITVAPTTYDLQGSTLIGCGLKSGTTALPNGLLVDATLCSIAGTPTSAVSAATYTVELATSSGTVDASVSISTQISLGIQIGGTNSATSISTTSFDAAGNVIVAGTYTAALTEGLSLPITGTKDLFVAKFSNTGTLTWAKHFGSAGVSATAISAIADSSNNVTVLAVYRGAVDAGDGNPVTVIGTDAAFVARYDADGTYVWSRFFNGTNVNFTQMGSLNVDADGDVALELNWSKGTADFGGGAITAGTGFLDAFIGKYSGVDGTQIWQKNINANSKAEVGSDGAGNAITEGPELAFDSNKNVVLQFIQNIGTWDYGDINGVPGSGQVTNAVSRANCYAVVVVKFGEADGATQWTKLLQSQNSVGFGLWNGSLTIDSQDHVISAVSYIGTVDVGASSNVVAEDTNVGDMMIIQFDGNGSYLWSQDLGSSTTAGANAVTIEADDQVAVAAYVEGSTTLSGQSLNTAGGFDALTLRYASDGTFVSAESYGGAAKDVEAAITSNRVSSIAAINFSSSSMSVGNATYTPVGTTDALIVSSP